MRHIQQNLQSLSLEYGQLVNEACVNVPHHRTQTVQVPINLGFEFWVILVIVQVLGRYMSIRYLNPWGKFRAREGLGLRGPNPEP